MAEHVRVAFQTQPWRVCAMAFALVAIFALAAACGGDDEPAPPAEPAAAAAQAQADEPAEQAADQADQTAEQADEQADEPAEQAADQADQPAEQAADQADQPAEQAADQADQTAEQAGPPGPVDIAVDGVTVGELLAMLSTAEVSCVQNQVGPAINAALNISVTTGMASGPIAAPIFSCVSDETATRVAVVLIVADAGLSAETADCIGGVLAATPAPLFPVAAEAAEGMLACMTEDEAGRAEAVFEIAPEEEAEPEEPEAAAEPDEPEAATDIAAPGGITVGEILSMLSTDEVACVQTQVGPAINAAQGIMVTTAMASGPIAAPIFGCVSPESGVQVAVALIVGRGRAERRDGRLRRRRPRREPRPDLPAGGRGVAHGDARLHDRRRGRTRARPRSGSRRRRRPRRRSPRPQRKSRRPAASPWARSWRCSAPPRSAACRPRWGPPSTPPRASW